MDHNQENLCKCQVAQNGQNENSVQISPEAPINSFHCEKYQKNVDFL